MPIHEAVAARFPLLAGIASLQEAMADPEKDKRVREFLEPTDAPPAAVPTRDLPVDGPHGAVPVRVYGDPDGADRPALLWMHGGGFMMGDLDMGEADWTAREICGRTGAVVVSVDYRLAVGGVHYPVPLDDCVAAARWLRDEGARLGVDPDRVAIGGASAGGNLAVATTLRLRDDDGWQPASVVAVYPVLHDVLPAPGPELVSRLAEVPTALRFTPEGTGFMNANYLGGRPPDGYSFPTHADLAGLAPTTVVTAEYDDLRTTGEAFVDQLRTAGVRVTLVQADGMLHGFLNLSSRIGPVDDVLQLVADRVVGTVPHPRPGALMSRSHVSKVVIIGGGIAGGVLALGLRQRGVEVVLVDQRSELGGVGHGITLQGNALKAFDAVGLYEPLKKRGFPFSHLRMKSPDGHVIAEMPTPPMGGPDLPGTMGAVRGDIADLLEEMLPAAGVDVRLGTTLTAIEDHGDGPDGGVSVTLADGTVETADLLVGADGIRSKVRAMIGIETEPTPVGMGIWRTVAKRPPEMDCSELYMGGPKFKAGYTPISEDLCYAFLLEENLDRSYIGEGPKGALLKEHGQGYGGIWGQVRDSLADDAIVNYQWIESICVESPWFRGRTIIIGDAAHACPPLIAQGAAMCAEDAVVLAEMLTSGDAVDDVLPAYMERRFPRVKMVLDNSLTLAEWEMHPETPGADPGRIMGQTLGALVAPA